MTDRRPPRYVARNLRLTMEEHDVLSAATEALSIQRSTLVQEGVIDAAHRLGLFAGGPDPANRPAAGAWRDNPQHRDESAEYRISISYSPTTDELLERAAAFVGLSPTRFAVGATMRYLSQLKKGGRKELRRVRLPKQYE